MCVMAVIGCAPHSVSLVPLPAHWEVHHADCPVSPDPTVIHAAACADDATGEVWIGAGRVDPFLLWHEMGHLFDAQRMTPLWRDWFTRVLRHPGPWLSSRADGSATPGELFADAYAACALGFKLGPRHTWETGYGYYPTRYRYRQFCRALWRV